MFVQSLAEAFCLMDRQTLLDSGVFVLYVLKFHWKLMPLNDRGFMLS